MASQTPTLSATPRERVGTHTARRLRSKGRLPAVIYGHKQDPVAVSVDEKETVQLLRDGYHVVNLSVDGNVETCLFKELQFGYLGDNVIHVDFARVDLNEEVTVHVHIHFTGEPAAAKKPGNILSHDMTELEVVCAVSAIPEEVTADLSKMAEYFTVEDLGLPEGVRATASPDSVIARISQVREVEEETGEAEEVAVESQEPELIAEGKRAEEGESEGEEEKE